MGSGEPRIVWPQDPRAQDSVVPCPLLVTPCMGCPTPNSQGEPLTRETGPPFPDPCSTPLTAASSWCVALSCSPCHLFLLQVTSIWASGARKSQLSCGPHGNTNSRKSSSHLLVLPLAPICPSRTPRGGSTAIYILAMSSVTHCVSWLRCAAGETRVAVGPLHSPSRELGTHHMLPDASAPQTHCRNRPGACRSAVAGSLRGGQRSSAVWRVPGQPPKDVTPYLGSLKLPHTTQRSVKPPPHLVPLPHLDG
jgi:hypothetical protein